MINETFDVKNDDEIWLPIIVKKEKVIRHSEGGARNYERDFYHYTIVKFEEIVFYNKKTGEIKSSLEIKTEDKINNKYKII